MFSILARTVNLGGNKFANISKNLVLANNSKSTVLLEPVSIMMLLSYVPLLIILSPYLQFYQMYK